MASEEDILDFKDGPKVGGTGRVIEKDDEVHALVQEIKPEFEKKFGKSIKELDVIHYRRQLVNGVNFFIKAKAILEDETSSIVHLRVYRSFRGKPELSAYQLDKRLEDKVEYFQ